MLNFTDRMKAHFFPAGRVLACLMIMALFPVFLKGQTFSYPGPLCSNGSVVSPVLSAGFPGGGNFTSNPGLNIIFTTGQINPASSTPGTYTVTYAGSSCNCVITTVINIHIATPVSISNATACASSTVSSLVVVANPSTGLSYTWSPSSVIGPSLNVFPPYAGQTITLTAVDGNGCKSQTATQIATVQGPPLIVSGPGTVCPGSSVMLSATGGNSYVWSTGFTGNVITVAPTSNTVYAVTATNASGCQTTITKTITLGNLNLTVNSPTLCSGDVATLSAVSIPNNGVTYFWYPGPLTGISVTVAPSATQSYTLLANRAGCTTSMVAQVTVMSSFTPVAGYSYNSPLCTNSSNQTPKLVTGFTQGGSFSAFGPAELAINDTTGVIDFTGIVPGDYLIVYNTAAVGCTTAANSTVMISVGQSGKIDLITDVMVLKGSSVTLSVSGGNYYNWDPPLYISCVTCDAPEVSPPESMRYCVSSDLCLEGGCVNVTVLCKNEGDLSVPNAFTPDGDGNNDKFCLQGWEQCIKTFEIRIFDRWGGKVYESDKADFCWDGAFNGQPLLGGVYTYVITASFELAPRIVKKGNITLMR